MNNADSSSHHSASSPSNQNVTTTTAAESTTTSTERTPEELRKLAANKVAIKRKQFLVDLVSNMDILCYAHLCYVYYLDNSFFWFFTRCMVQLFFLTPKPEYVVPPPIHFSSIVVMALSSIFPFCFHILNDVPTGSEAMGGYLHGSIIIDFIGQEGPISKFRLCILDLIVLILQFTTLSMVLTFRSLPTTGTATSDSTSTSAPSTTTTNQQDLDSEERGVRAFSNYSRSTATTGSTGSSTQSGTASTQEDETDESSALFSTRERSDVEDMVWDIYAGEFCVAEVNILRMVKEVWGKGK